MKSIFEQLGGQYIQVGDYYVPDLGQFVDSKHNSDDRPLGKYSRLHEAYLKEHKHAFYSHLLLSGKLPSYLRDVQEQAQNLLDVLLAQHNEEQGVTEFLKATDPMEWVGRMNNIVAQIEEAIYKEIVYA